MKSVHCLFGACGRCSDGAALRCTCGHHKHPSQLDVPSRPRALAMDQDNGGEAEGLAAGEARRALSHRGSGAAAVSFFAQNWSYTSVLSALSLSPDEPFAWGWAGGKR